MKRIALTRPILLLVLACGPADLTKVAQGLDALATATGTAQSTIIEMEAQKILDTDITRTILTVFQKVILAQREANSITRQLAAIDKPTQQQLQAIMLPITRAVKDLIDTGAAGIKNPDTKARVLLTISAVQSVITAINLSLS